MMQPTPSPVPPAIAPARDFHPRTGDGLIVAATYWPGPMPDAPAVLLLHGNGTSRAAMVPTAAWLAGQGYAVLAIDFRGHGESSPAPHSFGFAESRDVAAAFAWLKHQQHGAPVAVLGSSLGGAATMIATRRRPKRARCSMPHQGRSRSCGWQAIIQRLRGLHRRPIATGCAFSSPGRSAPVASRVDARPRFAY